MNAEQLLQHFDRISEAPDAIPRLRRFILDLAVRGKLVEQDPSDEPAAELLRWIKAEKASRRSARGSIRTEEEVERWCTIPATWDFVRLDEVCNVVMGSSPPGSTYNKNGEGVPLINGPVEFTPGPFGRTVINQYTTAPSAYCNEGDFLICVRGSTTGRTNIAAFRGCIGRGVAAIQPLFEDQFIRLAIRERQEAILQMGRGIAFPSISREQLAGLPVPLPPLPEQHRIIAKVDELMSLCDQLEAAKAEREQTRDRLVAASLQGLSQPAEKEETFREHARFTFNNLPRITTRSTHIKQLRQAILNLAVRGKLVPQDPSDEPAAELLKRIAAEKARLVKAGRGSNKNTPSPLSNNDQPYSLPSKWEWVRLGSISTSIQYGYTASADMAISVPRFVRITDIHNGRVDWDSVPGCEIEADKLPTYKLEENDFLVARTGGTIGKSFLVANVEHNSVFASYLIRIRVFPQFIYPQFLKYYLESPLYWGQLHAASMGTGQPNVNGKSLGLLKTPVPPLAEQHRIVARVDELMRLCDQLEAQITETEQDSRRYLEAVLHEALAPAMAEAA